MTKSRITNYPSRLTVLTFLFVLFLAQGVWAGTAVVQSFQLRDGRKLWGVLVRSFEDRIVLALPNHVEEIRKTEIMIAGGGMLAEAAKVDELLTLVEDEIASGRFERAQAKLEPLDHAIQEFKLMTRPFVESNLDTPHQRQECLLQAGNYYGQMQKELPGSIACLQLAEKVDSLKNAYVTTGRRCKEDSLSELTFINKELVAFGELISKAERAKERALSTIADLSARCVDELQNQAVDSFAASHETRELLRLFQFLKEGAGLGQIYEKKLLVLVNVCLSLCADVRNELSSSLGDTSFKDGDDKKGTAPDYANVSSSLRRLTRLLTTINDLMFGDSRQELQFRIASAIKSNDTVLESMSKIKELSIEIRAELRQAELLLEKDRYKDALKQYQRVGQMISASDLQKGEYESSITEGVIRSHAMLILSELDDPETKSIDEINQVISEAGEFLQSHGTELSAYDISAASIERASSRMKKYAKFYQRYDDLLNNFQTRPLEKWDRILMMTRWLQSLGATIHKKALDVWDGFLAENENQMYQEAVIEFFELHLSIGEKELKTVVSFVRNRLNQRDPDGAFDILRKAVSITREEVKGAVGNDLRLLASRIANQFTAIGKPEKTKLVYELVREVSSEAMAKGEGSDDDIRLQMINLADWQQKNNQPVRALETLESIASDYSEYAADKKIYGKILDLYLEIAGRPEPGSNKELETLNRMCEKYPQTCKNIPMIQERSQDFVEQFSRAWEEGSYSTAADTYLNFEMQYPNFVREGDVIEQTLKRVRTKVYMAHQTHKELDTSVKNSLTTALQKIVQKYPVVSSRNKLDLLLVDIELQRAENLLKNRQVRRAFGIYNQILAAYPNIGQDKGLYQKMERLRWNYKMETILRPLGITRTKDWIAFGIVILIFPISFLRSYAHGKRRGHLKYRLVHWGTIFLISAVLLCGFIYGKFPFFEAFLFALVIPGICFQFIGSSTYLFFPLVYWERLLRIEKTVLNLLRKFSKKDAEPKNAFMKFLDNDIKRRKNDLPVLHDRTLYKIEKAIHVSSTKPEKGYELFNNLLTRLDQEILRPKTWTRHYGTCLYNMGAIANHLDRRDEAIEYLNKHLEYDPKSVDARNLLSEMLFETNDFEEAIPHLKVCLAAYGDSDNLWFRLGRCFFGTGDYVSAYKCFSSVKEKDRESLFFQARSYAKANELDKAVDSYQTLLKHYPGDSEAIYYLASTFAHFGDNNKAIKITSLINFGDPLFARTQALLGSISHRSKRVKEANELFVKALKIDPSCILAMVGLAQIAIGVDKKDQAQACLEKAVQVDHGHPAANYFFGTLTERINPEESLSYYHTAAKSPDFKRLAERRIGVIQFFNQNYSDAAEHLRVAAKNGEDSTWVLYLLAYALASTKELNECQETLTKIARGKVDSFWKSAASNAMYSLGLTLFHEKDFKLALKCFQFVQSKHQNTDQSDAIGQLLEESKFRMVVQLLDKGDFKTAQTTLDGLIKESKEEDQERTFRYYLALCFIYQKRYKEAKQILTLLCENDRNNASYAYHLVVVELGEGNDQQAAKLLVTLRKHLNLPAHLRIGVQMIRAYLLAKQGKMRNAESSLTNISELETEFAGVEYMRQKAIMSRVFYLCHARDSRKIHSVTEQLTGDQKARAILMHAIAAVESGQLTVAQEILKPYVEESAANRKLFSTICTEIAVKAISSKNYQQARLILEEIPDRSEVIEGVSLLLNMAELLQSVNDFESTTKAIAQLTDYLTKVDHPELRHSLIHNLAILQLKRVIMAEEMEAKNILDDLWRTCWQFWMDYVFTSQEYWNFEQRKFAGPGKAVKNFTQKEVEVIYKRFIDENFADMFISYLTSYLAEVDEKGVARHLGLLNTIGNETGNLKTYHSKLRERLSEVMKSVNKTDERYATWEFNILSLTIQSSTSNTLNLDDREEISRKLRNYQEYKEKYASPKAYRQAQKQFNSNLLDALHLGIDKKFAEAGNKLDKVLNGDFPGLLPEETIDRLLMVRESCRRFSKGTAGGDDLKKKFEDLYVAVTGNKMSMDVDLISTQT